MMNLGRIFSKGLIFDNPIFVQVLGMCPTLAVTTSAQNGLGMGLATTAVLIGSNLVISLTKKVIPSKIRIPAFVVIIATFVTMVGMLLKAYLPALDAALGIFIPLIVVNCIILARAESFASKNSVIGSIVDGLGTGLGFAGALVILGGIREFFGSGSVFGTPVLVDFFHPARIISQPPGAFLVLGLLLAIFNGLTSKGLNEK